MSACNSKTCMWINILINLWQVFSNPGDIFRMSRATGF